MKYRALWFIEIILVLLLAFDVFIPIQDYAMREFKEYLRRPSPETLKAFQEKRDEESRLRAIIAIPLAAAVLTLAFPIYRIRSQKTI